MNLYKYYKKPQDLVGGTEQHYYVSSKAYDWLQEHPDDERALKCLAKDAWDSFYYANELGKPWPPGEPAMAKNVRVAMEYSTELLQGRFLMAEPYLKKLAKMPNGGDYTDEEAGDIGEARDYFWRYGITV